MERYGPDKDPRIWVSLYHTMMFYEGIGILVKRGLVDIEMVDDLLYNVVQRDWPRMGPIIDEWRKYLRARYGERERKHDNWGGLRLPA